MSIIEKPFVFEYKNGDQSKTITFTPGTGNLIPVSRVVQHHLGMVWRANRDRIRLYSSFCLLKFEGYQQKEAALSAEDFITWLHSLNLKRVKNSELVKFFQRYFELAWKSYLNDLDNPHPICYDDAILGDYAGSKEDTKKRLAALNIYIDRPLTDNERFIAFLAKFDLFSADCLAYCADQKSVCLAHPIFESDRPTVVKDYVKHLHTFTEGLPSLKARIGNGWLPIWIFYMQYPEFYEQQIGVRKEVKETVVGNVKEYEFTPQQFILEPWNADLFAKKIATGHKIVTKITREKFIQGIDDDKYISMDECRPKSKDFTHLKRIENSDFCYA